MLKKESSSENGKSKSFISDLSKLKFIRLRILESFVLGETLDIIKSDY